MQKAQLPGDFLPWRDVLHEGPVPKDLSLDELSKVRAEYIAGQGWGNFNSVHQNFKERDLQLKSSTEYDKIILWFEHDLYDQLQILQILDWCSQQQGIKDSLSMICTDNYLGEQTTEQVQSLLVHEQKVTDEQLRLARTAWTAFRDDTPKPWQQLLEADTAVLPYLNAAVLRLLQEYPSGMNGLSCTAQKALEIIAGGESSPVKIFVRYQMTEEQRFLGDASFWNILNSFLDVHTPLLKLSKGKRLEMASIADQRLTITDTGKAVLAGEKDWLGMQELDCWIGGVHLSPGNLWRWDQVTHSLSKITN